MELNPQHPWAPDPANMKQPRGGWDEVSQNPEAKRVRSADRNRAGKKYLDWLECEYIADAGLGAPPIAIKKNRSLKPPEEDGRRSRKRPRSHDRNGQSSSGHPSVATLTDVWGA
jgi:hypothetical protein